MSYREIPIPEELNWRIQEMLEIPPQRHQTLGELIATYNEQQGAPSPEDLVSERPTRHEARAGERTFHTHCFLDALVLPLVLGEERVEIRSESPVSGEEITAVVSDGAASVEYSPPEAIVSFGVTRAGHGPPQVVGCPYINAFSSRAEYERWEAQTPQAVTTPLSVGDAFALGRDAVGGTEAPSERADG
jgi:hypothetical protein